MSDEPTPAERPALTNLLEPTMLDGLRLEADAMRASVRQRLFGGPPSTLRIDRFIVLARLGAGGMGVVYLAQDPSLSRKVAIKLLHDEGARHAHAHARLQREARALASLSHPNVVVVHEVGVYEGQLYLVMEHVAGQTLREWTRDHATDWRAIVEQYRAAGEGLAAAHRAGIIHRDFKPDNVLVDEDGRARVLDFGLAAAEAEPAVLDESSWEELRDVELTKTGAILGTPAYMAPEQLLGTSVDARTDQFSFCVALWEALFEQRPFAGDDLRGLRREVIAGRRREPPARRGVPRSIVAALARGLALEPADRFATMTELLHALAEPHRRPWRRAWLSVGLASLGGVAVAVALLASDLPTTAPRPSSASVSPAPSGPPDEPAVVEPSPAPERLRLATRPLTHTPGLGVILASVDPERRNVLYGTNLGELRLLPLSGEEQARPVALPISPTVTAHCGPDGTYWLVGDGAIRRARADGEVERVIELPEDSKDLRALESFVSPDGTALAIPDGTGFVLWELSEPDDEPLRFELDGSVYGAAWSPDASQIAVIVEVWARGEYRLDVFDVDGGLRSSTMLPTIMEGRPGHGLAWLPSGIVTVAFDPAETWVQCLTVTEAGVERGPRSAALATRPPVGIAGATADHALIVRWTDTRSQLLVLDRSTAPARVLGSPYEVRRSVAGATWLSESELAFLGAEPPGALVKAVVDQPGRLELLAAGPFDWASGDGDGGVVLGSSDGTVIEHLARDSTDLRHVQLPGVATTNPFLRCRSPRDCLLVSDGDPAAFFGVDLEREHLRRRFSCPIEHVCERGAWGWSPEGDEVLLIEHRHRGLSRFHAQTGRALGQHPPPPPWVTIQSVTATARGELLLTGMLDGIPPDGNVIADYRMLRLDDDGTYHSLWSSEQTWIVRPVASPSGQRIAVEGRTFHGDLVELELGSLCAAAP